MTKNPIHTKLCDMLDIEYPIILAGMGGYAGPTLAAAVSNAGGLGVMGCTGFPIDTLVDMIRKTRSLTSKPFGVDILMPLPVGDLGSESAMKIELPAKQVEFVNQLKREFGVPEPEQSRSADFFNVEHAKREIEICIEERVPVFVSGLGNPASIVPQAHAQGMKVIACVGNVRNARRVAEGGVDIVVAAGHEGGGHTGRIGTMALIPQVVDAVYPTPVVAAGGIADGRGLAAALALGACGVWVGTAFLVCPEAHVDAIEMGLMAQWETDYWKQKIIEGTEEDTVVTKSYTGKTMRNLKNKWIDAWGRPDAPPTLPMPLQTLLCWGAMEGAREAVVKDVLLSPTGQIAGMIKETKTAKQVVDDMVQGALRVLEGML
ncbi:MAG: nitronate monooxygenase [Dehalococcoidia bacterium]|nr:nitronate monooxygenase [Dehalococcoidia bacterium]